MRAQRLFVQRKQTVRLMTHLVVWKNDESTTTGRFDDDGQEFWVYGAKCRVPAALRHANIIVALFPLNGRPVNVTKLGTSDNAKRHDG